MDNTEEVQQNTKSWLAWRKKKIGASEAPIIMGVSKFSTPHQLWLEKTGRKDSFSGNFATERGSLLEPFARSRYELKSEIDLPATIKVHPKYKFISASLDGYNEEHGIVLEIKVPGKEVFSQAKAGICHEQYYAQCQQQLMVTGAKEVHFFCCLYETKNGDHIYKDDALVIVKPDVEYQKELLIRLLAFYRFMQEDIPPPLSDRDYLEADDESSVLLFARVKKAKQRLAMSEKTVEASKDAHKQLEQDFAALKEEIIEHCEALGHPKISCCGLTVNKNKNGIWVIRQGEAE